MSKYTLEVSSEKVTLSNRRCMLQLWVSSVGGFEDPGVFLLHRRRTHVNGRFHPMFETFANPCTLVEYPYRACERNHGMYRDRGMSIEFPTSGEADGFLSLIEERRLKLLGHMNRMEEEVAASAVEEVGGVSIRTSDLEAPFVRIDLSAGDRPLFIFRDGEFPKFVGVAGVLLDTEPKDYALPELSIMTYKTRVPLFLENIREDLALVSTD